MTSLIKRFTSRQTTVTPTVDGWPALPFQDWVNYFNYGSATYPFHIGTGATALDGKHEDIPQNFVTYVEGVYKQNGVIFACMEARRRLFSQARFQYQRVLNGVPGKLFGTQGLSLLEKPWTNGTTSDLLSRYIQDADLAGNAYVARVKGPNGPILTRLRPDWVTIVIGSRLDTNTVAGDPTAEILGYIYHNKDRRAVAGSEPGTDVYTFLAEEVAHFAPIPDPTASYRGMSWLTAALNDTLGDSAMTSHKTSFFENGAYLQTIVSLSEDVEEDAFAAWIANFNAQHQGSANAYKTLFLGGGADVKVIGTDLQSLDFRNIQAHAEARICMVAGVQAILAGVVEGLDASTYSNYQTARRVFADGTMRPLWEGACNALATLVPPEKNARLWYDDRHIHFLREDEQDAAKIRHTNASTAQTLINAGFEPESVKSAIISDDFSLLTHSGLVSVQLQPPGSDIGEENTAAPGGPGGDAQGQLNAQPTAQPAQLNGNGGRPQLPSGATK